MTLEVRDIDYVRYQSSAIVLGLSLTRAPDELETEVIQAWPVAGTERPLRVEGRDLVVEVPSAAAATACVAWLMGPDGLAAMYARATAVAEASERLYSDMQTLIHERYDAAPPGAAPRAHGEAPAADGAGWTPSPPPPSPLPRP